MEYVLATVGQVVPPDTGLEKYGPLGIMSLLFLSAIIVLWRRSEERQKVFDAKQDKWVEERQELLAGFDKLRIEFAEKHSELADAYANDLRVERDKARDHEDETRREFSELMELVATKQLEGQSAIAAVLEKFHARFISPGARGPRGSSKY